MQQTATESLVGRKLEGRYRILDRIARGGMSTVYAAVDERLDRLVAVKVMSSALSSDPAFSDRFAREARAAARLTHLNAVSVYDQGHEIGPDGHHVFLVMELVEGRTLRELVRERGKLEPAEAVSIMEPVLSALSAAHRAGLVHRDVKPENILLSDEGVVKVADFGLARAVETDPSSTRTGLMMGTVAYCSPEQITRGHADPRSDVYSAGIVLFELLTGRPPYSGESAMNIAYQHVHSRVPAPSSKLREIPTEIDEIVVAATDSDPTGRPADAAAMLAELADARTALALPVVPVPARPREERRASEARTQRSRTPERATTDSIGGTVAHDTAVVPGPNQGTQTAQTVRTGQQRAQRRDGPPPPVVIPPPNAVDQRAKRRRRALIATALVLALGLGAFFGAKAFIEWRFAHVPNVDTLPRDRAVSELEDAGYKVVVLPGGAFDEKVARGRVLRTDPGNGSRLATGKTVKITLSYGPRLYTIPDLSGKDSDTATETLRALGVKVSAVPTRRTSDTVRTGEVITTDPKAGTKVTKRQTVTLVVSKGPAVIAVPDIPRGTPVDEARKKLTDKKFEVRTQEQYSDEVPQNGVISVSPDDRATKFSAVTLTVSRGPEFVDVPKISRGTPVATAERRLRDANLVPEVRRIVGDDDDGGVVIATTPDGGDRVRSGSTVTLYVI